MRMFIIILFLAIGIGFFISCGSDPKTTENTQQSVMSASLDADGASDKFPDFGWMLDTSQYRGPVFKLSQDYPKALPKTPLPAFFQTDFKKDWRKYLEQVQDYCFEGNTGTDFRVENNKTRAWYHMPWQHYGPPGREGFHGLTQEAPVQPRQLAATQTSDSLGAVAVGFYNDVAAYTIGQVWKDHYAPDHSKNIAFPNGSVLFKILFVNIPEASAVAEVPWLENGLWWDAYVVTNFKKNMGQQDQNKYRRRTKVALVQMDIMVRDDRAPSGWIFGNFQYNGKLNKGDKWKNLIPVGLMWGEDPEDSTNASNPQPTHTVINTKLKETIINPDSNELPATHLGWNSRLNGPVDNPMSSCYSCHSTAEYPQYTLMSPLFNSDTLAANPIGSPGWMRWFRNLPCGTPFNEDAHSMDFSLQLAGSLQNFYDWKSTQSGLFSNSYSTDRKLLNAEQTEGRTAGKKTKLVHPIRFK